MAENENAVVAKEVRDRSPAELRSLMAHKREELQKTKFKHALGQLRETHQLRSLKKDIARLSTVLNELERAEGKGA